MKNESLPGNPTRADADAPPSTPIITDAELLTAVSTFYNGCDFAVTFDGSVVAVHLGCYGVHKNLAQGARRSLLRAVEASGGELVLPHLHPVTIRALKTRKPCRHCGSPFFRAVTSPQP